MIQEACSAGEGFNPRVGGEFWRSRDFYIDLMGNNLCSGGMRTLQLLAILWDKAPNLVSVAELSQIFQLGPKEIQSLISKARKMIRSPNHPLAGKIAIITSCGHGYRLMPVVTSRGKAEV